MKKRIVGPLVALTLAAPVGVVAVAAPAEAHSLQYANCTALTRTYHHGVARSHKAALRQVRAGYHIPAYGTRARKVYWANYRSMDRDKDGTACER